MAGLLPDDLKKDQEKLQKLLQSLYKSYGDGEQAISKLQARQHDDGFNSWLRHLFRPGNPQRLSDAISSMSLYTDALQTGINLANQLKGSLPDLGNAQNLITSWQKEVKSLIPLRILQITFPDEDFSGSFSKYTVHTELFDVMIGVMTGFGMVFGGPLLALEFLGITAIIGGIIDANKDMDLYNDIKSKADSGRAQVDSKVITPLQTSIQSVSSFWTKAAFACTTAGYLGAGDDRPADVINALNKLVSRVANFNAVLSMYNALVPDGNIDKLAASAAKALCRPNAPTQSDIDEFKFIFYFNQKHMDINAIAKLLKIDPSQVVKLQAKELLDEGKPPNEIATQLNLSLQQVQKIQKLIDSSK